MNRSRAEGATSRAVQVCRWGHRIVLSVLCWGALLTTAQAEVRIAAAKQTGSLPIFVAEAQGYFAAEGVTVRLIDCAFGKLCLRMVLDGQAQMGTVADLPIVLEARAGQRFAVLATINTNRNDTKIVTHRGRGIKRAAQLVDRTVGLHVGTTAQFALESLLLVEGVDPTRVKMVDLRPGEGRERLLAGTIDAAALFEPYAVEAARALGADAVVLGTSHIYTQTWNLVMGRGAAPASPAEVEALLRALHRACEWIGRHPADAKVLLRQRIGLDADLVEASWPALEYQVKLDQRLLALLEGQSRWAERRGLASGAMPNFLDIVQTGPLRRVRPSAVTIVD